MSWLKRRGFSSFAVGGSTGMSEEVMERVHGRHDPDFQKDVAGGICDRRRA